MKEIKITQGKTVLVSDEDFQNISQFKWAYSASTGYAVRKGRKILQEPRTVHMHRFIMGASSKVQIDHINGNKLDNRRLNLRIASIQKNAFNRKKPKVICTSKYKGVLKRKNSNRWEARIKFNNKSIHLGRFINEVDAAKAYNRAALYYFGEFARCNDI
ncbi:MULTISPECIES: HNH endonuclease [unclassified Clostridium]|uniref:HNH endonuclease n=1 Tax=unclassified Clostridium TaxID=2614128 RepID=UPI003217C72E